MSKILLDKLIEDLDPHLKSYIEKDPKIRQSSQDYLQNLFENENLISTEIFTTTNDLDSKRTKTLTEEIAELDEYKRNADIKLSDITNENRDSIVEISENLKNINQTITTEMKDKVESMIKEMDNFQYEINISDQLTSSIETNTSMLSNIDSILDLLELPTLCKICILQGNYQESLDISMLAKTLIAKFPKISIFQKINNQINKELNLMIKNLIKLLNTNLKQNNLIKIFNILNQLDLVNLNDNSTSIDLISNNQSIEKTRFLKIIYLNSRFKFITNEISNLTPLIKFNKLSYLKRFIEVFRSEIYQSVSMFYSIINHSLNLIPNENEDLLLLNQFVKNLSYLLITELKTYFPEILSQDLDQIDIKNQLDGIILQIIYLCKSLSKYNLNFENIITWELIYKHEVIKEGDWLGNLSKVKNFH
ncbi:hypothetical protein CLIB1444_07S01904 [[Candida] jaroonii]|uniref:Uncharacterized protein n=1 Tax=[Candida] jaroonii TaxID=467808 RepID=A0ACA9YAB7_9ASCO|nr:hypothetical protein CLIB1444_07S01904 [[Candida] jaroonii]